MSTYSIWKHNCVKSENGNFDDAIKIYDVTVDYTIIILFNEFAVQITNVPIVKMIGIIFQNSSMGIFLEYSPGVFVPSQTPHSYRGLK